MQILKGNNNFDCHCLLLAGNRATVLMDRNGLGGDQFYQNQGDVKIIEVNIWCCDELGSPDDEC